MPATLVTALRLLLTAGILGSAFAMLVAGSTGGEAAAPASPTAQVVAFALLAVALVATWRRGDHLLLAAVALVGALLVEGSGPVAALAGWLATAFAIALGCAHMLLPLLARSNVRVPANYRLRPQAWQPLLASAAPETRAAVAAVRALGFEPAAGFTFTAGTATTRLLLALNPDDPAIATLTQIDDRGRTTHLVEFTQALADGEVLAVATHAGPETLPRAPGAEVFLLDATPAEAFVTLERLRTGRALREPPRDAASLAVEVEAFGNRLLDFWVREGWVSREVEDGARRLTLKGAFLATWKQLWPGRLLVAQRARERLQAALGAAVRGR